MNRKACTSVTPADVPAPIKGDRPDPGVPGCSPEAGFTDGLLQLPGVLLDSLTLTQPCFNEVFNEVFNHVFNYVPLCLARW
jgi:hypothetical protein